MDRSKRFHQKKVAKVRFVREIWDDMRGWERSIDGYSWRRSGLPRYKTPWKKWCHPTDYSKNPGWWDKLHSIKPARIESSRLSHMVVKGRDPDAILWPKDKRPKLYYW